MIAAKHFDPVMGVDIHIIQPPGPVPPLPVPHPFVGMLVDPTEYAPIIGGTVKFNGMMRGVAGTGGKAIPPHIPIGGVFVMPPGNECEMFMGSATVTVDGDPQSRLGDPVLSCHSVGMPSIPRLKIHAKPKTLMLPTSVVLAVPMGPPVLVGGPPTISMMGMAMKFGLAGLGKAMKKLKKLQKASKKWKAISDKMHKAMDKVLDKVPGGSKLKGKASNAICSLTGHPVDVASGKVTTESTDVELPGPLPFKFSRVWYSQSTYAGPLGHGWHHSYDLGLYSFPEGVAVRLADGRFVVFQPPVPGEPAFDRTERLFLHLTERGYHAETLDGLVYHFGWPNKNGNELPLDHVRDPNGNRIQLERDRGKLTAFIDSGGRRLPVTTDSAGRITEVRVPDPDKPGETYPMVTFHYDRHGDLVRADDALGNPFRYEYLDHLLVRETDRVGLAFYFMYDGSGPDAKCLRTWGDGNLFLRDLSYDDARQRTEVTNSLGHKTVYEWNAAGLVVKETDPLGGVTLTEWSPHNDRLSVTDPNGGKTAFAYDDFGRLAGVVDPTGAAVQYEYDAVGNVVTLTSPDGGVWKREYDDRGNVTAVIDPLGHRQTFRLTDRGLPSTVTDALGHAVVFTWTGGGQLASRVDRTGARTTVEYDTLGRRVAITGATGNVVRCRYERRGLMVAATGPDGTTTCKYDLAGNMTELADPAGRVYTFRHTFPNRIAEVRSPLGRVKRYEYDTEGELVAAHDPGDRVWRFVRDANGRVVTEETYDGRTLRYRYDPAGLMVESRNARGQATTFERDAAGRTLRRVNPDGSTDVFRYTAAGMVAAAKNATAEVTFRYDPCGRAVEESVNGKVSRHTYDPVGNRVKRVSPLGRTLHFEIDPEGRLLGVAEGNVELFRSRLDPLGRETERVAGSTVWNWDYLPTGDMAGVVVRGRETRERRFEYNPAGDPLSCVDNVYGRTDYDHNADGYLTAVRHADGTSQEYTYDLSGDIRRPERVRVRRDADGQVVEKVTPDARWQYEYDGAGQLSRASTPDGLEVKFAYDPFGRRVRKTVGADVTEFFWDGDVPLGERGRRTAEYLFRDGTFEPLAVFDVERAAVIECDPVGLPRTAWHADGELAWQAEFEPFGELRSEAGRPGLVPLRNPGQYADAETGLFYNRFRYHDPEQRGYTRPDALGLFGGGVWDYVPSPLTWSDPYGLAPIEKLNPDDVRFSQRTAGGNGRAEVLRDSMGKKGWKGEPVDAVRTPDGVTTLDNTRVAVARELDMKEVPVRVHAPNEPLPKSMIGRFGPAKTWGEALANRTSRQIPPLPPTGTLDAPKMPKAGCK